MIDQGSPIAQAKYMQLPKRWPLVNNLNSRNQLFDKDARLINAYAEKDRSTGEYQVEKRPGFSIAPVVMGTPGVGHGMTSINMPFTSGIISPELRWITIYISGALLYYFTTSSIGISTPSASLGLVAVFNNLARFLSVPDINIIIFNSGGGSLTVGGGISDGATWVVQSGYDGLGIPIFSKGTMVPGDGSGWPAGTVPGMVYLNGFAYVMDYTGQIWQTTTQNIVFGPASWSGTAHIQAASDSDLGVILAKQLIYVVAIKSWTVQFYYDAGNTTGSSLSPVPGATYNFGCLSPDTFADLDGTLIFATQSKDGTHEIVKITNLQYEVISTPAVERQLDLGGGIPAVTFYATAYQHSGHRWYIITNTKTNVTMVYDIGEKLWYLWTDYLNSYYPVASRSSAYNSQEWQQMISTGNIYQLDGDYVYPNDSGNIVPVDIYTPNFDAGVDRIKQLSQMRFNADQTAGSKLWVQFSDNDYKTWNNYRVVDLGRVRPILNDEGSFYKRAYHFRHYANTGLRIRSVDLQMDLGIL